MDSTLLPSRPRPLATSLRRTKRVLTLLVALGALWAPSAQAAGAKAIWGPTKLPNGASAFPKYRDLGVDVFQMQLNWKAIASTRPANPADPDDPAYRWPSRLQRTIDEASSGSPSIKVALLVRQTPGWANRNSGISYAPDQVQDYADFLTAASKRYPAVNRWMIWGETNRAAVWRSGPQKYAELLDAAYGALKPIPLIDPDVVVGGMTFTYGETSPAAWITAMRLPNGRRPRMDEYGHNPFTRRCPDLSWGPNYLQAGARDISDIDTLREDVRSAFGSYKPLWLSEFTVSSDRGSRAFTFFVSRKTQADWLTRAYRIAGHATGVSGLGWFNLIDEDAANGLTTGLLDANLVAKPAFDAFKAASLDDTGPPPACPRPAVTPSPPPPPPSPSPPRADRAAPAVAMTVKRTVAIKSLIKGLNLEVSCNERCRASATLLLDKRTARRIGLSRRPRSAVKIGTGSASLGSGSETLRVKLTSKAKRRLRRARTGTLTLRLSVRDASGNVTTTRRTIALKR